MDRPTTRHSGHSGHSGSSGNSESSHESNAEAASVEKLSDGFAKSSLAARAPSPPSQQAFGPYGAQYTGFPPFLRPPFNPAQPSAAYAPYYPPQYGYPPAFGYGAFRPPHPMHSMHPMHQNMHPSMNQSLNQIPMNQNMNPNINPMSQNINPNINAQMNMQYYGPPPGARYPPLLQSQPMLIRPPVGAQPYSMSQLPGTGLPPAISTAPFPLHRSQSATPISLSLTALQAQPALVSQSAPSIDDNTSRRTSTASHRSRQNSSTFELSLCHNEGSRQSIAADTDADFYSVMPQDEGGFSRFDPSLAYKAFNSPVSPHQFIPSPMNYSSSPLATQDVPLRPADSNEEDVRKAAAVQLADIQQLPTSKREVNLSVIDDGSRTSMQRFPTIAAVLRFRAHSTPRALAFTILDSKGREFASITYEKLNSRAEKISQTIKEKSGLSMGDNVALIYRRSEMIEYLVALFGCFYAGVVAVPIITHSVTLDDEVTEIIFIMESCHITLALTTEVNIKNLSKDFGSRGQQLPKIDWWRSNEFGYYQPKKKGVDELVAVNAHELAYIEYSKSQMGELKGIIMDHTMIMNLCLLEKASNDWKQSDVVLSSIEPRQQYGLLMGAFWGVYNGAHVVFMSEGALESNGVWGTAVTKYKGL